MNANVIIYTTAYCPYCTRAKLLLQTKGVPFEEIRVEGRHDLRKWLQAASGQHTVPQIFINGRSYGGFSDIAELDRQGELEPLLQEAPVKVPSMPR